MERLHSGRNHVTLWHFLCWVIVHCSQFEVRWHLWDVFMKCFHPSIESCGHSVLATRLLNIGGHFSPDLYTERSALRKESCKSAHCSRVKVQTGPICSLLLRWLHVIPCPERDCTLPQIPWPCDISQGKNATIHQLTTVLATSNNVLLPGHSHLLMTLTCA